MKSRELKFILTYYGEESQRHQAIQELNELAVAISKQDVENMIEEIADVEIMLQQLKMFEFFDNEVFERIKDNCVNLAPLF